MMHLEHDSKHWTSIKFSETLMMDALLKHLLGLTVFGMTDPGEVLEVAVRLKPNDEHRWIECWTEVARRLHDRAEKAEAEGRTVTAASAFLRASTYWRASLMYFSFPEDPRMVEHAEASTACYRRYLSLSGYPGEPIAIPYEGTTLPGYFYRSPSAPTNGPLLILTPGRDTWAEDTRWVYDGALQRGIHCLIYDGPGQGFALRMNNLKFRPDWEKVITPVVDFALTLPDIDPDRIGLMGMSFGGYLVPRAAAFEKRIKLCVADPGSLSWGHGMLDHFPAPLRQILTGGGPDFLRQLTIAGAERTSLEWMIRDYAWKHGVAHEAVFTELLKYDNAEFVDRIECEVLVLDGAEEMSKDQPKKLFDALKGPKDYLFFDETTTAQAHCQMGSYSTATELLLDEIARRL
jgi:pimeloyl-ACP methyl ester carboxylesterase